MLIVVLGMHRSGTSALTGLLEACGFSPGVVPGKSRGNAKGNREYQPVRRINNELLEQAGGSWREPVAVDSAPRAWIPRMQEVLATLQAEHPRVVIKDPRMLFTWEAWLPLLPAHTRIVGAFRHPVAVANSLLARNRFVMPAALNLWSQYNQALVNLHREKAFPLVSFDLTGEHYLAQFSALARQMSLNPDPEQVRAFYDVQLVNQRQKAGDLPEEQQALYAYLNRHRLIEGGI